MKAAANTDAMLAVHNHRSEKESIVRGYPAPSNMFPFGVGESLHLIPLVNNGHRSSFPSLSLIVYPFARKRDRHIHPVRHARRETHYTAFTLHDGVRF